VPKTIVIPTGVVKNKLHVFADTVVTDENDIKGASPVGVGET
jgi:hypothetical protein